YTLNPLVIWFERIKIPRVVGSTLVILAVIVAIIGSGYGLRGQVQSIITKLPEAATKLTSQFATKRGDPLSNIQKVQIAANQVEKATSSMDETGLNKKRIMHVVVDERKFKIGDYLWRGSLGFVGF